MHIGTSFFRTHRDYIFCLQEWHQALQELQAKIVLETALWGKWIHIAGGYGSKLGTPNEYMDVDG